jgi:tight adherence protein C
MQANLLLLISMVTVGGALVMLVLAVSAGAGETTGVARSLALIENGVDAKEVSKHDLPVADRLLLPLLDRTRRPAPRRASPSDWTSRATRATGRPSA